MSQTFTTATKRVIAPPKGIQKHLPFLHRILEEEGGQVLPWVAVVMVVVLGMAALSVDLGRAMVIRRQLQVQADAAALAAVENISDASFTTWGQNYSGASGQKNVNSGINIGTPTIKGLCLTTVAGTGWNIPCNSLGYNAVQVTETATIPTVFAQLVGKPTLTISATSTASPGRLRPYNVAVILDTTPSMITNDPSCSTTTSKTQLQCAVEGIQGLLKGLSPSMDHVSLFTFPNLFTTDVSNEYNCAGSNNLSVPGYTFPSATATTLSPMNWITWTTTGNFWSGYTTTQNPTKYATYQIVDYSSDYKSTDSSTTLNSGSNLVKAVGGKSGCKSMGTGNENTYYAGAIYAAQASLIAQQTANPGTLNAMILLSDGNATAKQSANGSFSPGNNDMAVATSNGNESSTIATNSGTYPSWVGECSQAVDAAQAASKAGTLVYTIAYGAPTTSSSANCKSDRTNSVSYPYITPCQTLQNMATGYTTGETKYFYSDYNYGSDSGCKASGANSGTTAIADIYKWIAADLAGARLIPNDTP